MKIGNTHRRWWDHDEPCCYDVDISVLGPPGVTSNIGSLNPDLYKSPLIPEEDTSNYPDGHLGRFWFSLNYDQDQEKLIINLIRIHNLPSRDKDSTAACDPLVRYTVASTLRSLFITC